MLAIDWGTTSFRAYRLDAEGGIVDSRSAPAGILAVQRTDDGGWKTDMAQADRFAEVLEEHAGDWINAGETQIVMSGMIGSRQGWMEVPYAACPARVGENGAGVRALPGWGRGEGRGAA